MEVKLVSANNRAHFGGAFTVISSEGSGPVYLTQVEYREPVTIAFWSDGTKTKARCSAEDTYSKEAGLMVCLLKKTMGNQFTKRTLNDWLPKNDEKKVDLKVIRTRQKETKND